MKILHVIPYFAPAWAYGGTPRAAYEIAKAQQALGHEVSVLTTDAFSDTERFRGPEVIEGVQVYRVQNLSNWICWKYHFVTPRLFPSELQQQQFDVIHLHEVRTLLNYWVLTHVKTKKFILSPWGTLPLNNRFSTIKSLIDILFIPQLQQKIAVTVAQNEHEKQVLEQFGIGRKKIIVPLGVDAKFFTHLPSKLESRRALSVPKSHYLFLFLGRFSPVKGIELVLEAVAALPTKDSQVSLLLVGRDDGYSQQLRRYVKELRLEQKVIFSGPLYDRDRLLAYRAADCFVSVPTVYEETSTTCLEALLCGVPVITSFESQIPFLEPADGVIHIPSQSDSILSAMQERLHKAVSPNTRKIASLFDWKAITKSLLRSCYE